MATEEKVVDNAQVEAKEETKKIKESVATDNTETDTKKNEDKNGEPENVKDENKNGETDKKNEVEGGDKNTKEEEKKEVNGDGDKNSSALEKKIVRQIEYYFGDINLPKDRFLQEQIKLDDGWVPMATMLNFKRLASLSMDEKYILETLKKSSQLMEVNEEEKKIRREPTRPLPEWNDERKAELNDRTVYVKGFPTEGMNLDIFLAFFKKYGKIDNIFLKMFNDKLEKKSTFKGSVYVLFNDKNEAEKFLELESVKYNDVELEKMWSKDHNQDKKRKVRETKEEMRKKFARKPAEKDDDDDDDVKEPKKDFVPAFSKLGTILHMTGFARDTTREDINEKLEPYDMEIAYVDYVKGNEEAWIRLQEENTVKELEEKIKGETNFTICGAEIKCRALEGEEETTYLEKAKEDKEKRWQNNQRKKAYNRGRGGRGRGGRGRGRGFKRSNRDDGGSSRPKRQRRDS